MRGDDELLKQSRKVVAMRATGVALIVLAAAASPAVAAVDLEQPPLSGVTAVRLANYGAPSVPIASREDLKLVLEELRQLRGKSWRRGDTPLECYSSVIVIAGKRTLTVFRVAAGAVVERVFVRGQAASYSLPVEPEELLKTNALLAEAPPAKGCAGEPKQP